jgi:hypothetical protein
MAATIDYYGELFNGKVDQKVRFALETARVYGLALVAARTPVDTGLLKSKWQAQLEAQGIRWLNDAPYAGFVELGTRKMAPRHMLTNSLPDIERVFEDTLMRTLGAEAARKAISPAQYPTYQNQGTPRQQVFKGFSPRAILNERQVKDIISARPQRLR